MSEWISVKESLPDVSGYYLAHGNRETAVVRFDPVSRKWHSRYYSDEVMPEHWMPLPEPPPRKNSFEQWWDSIEAYSGTWHNSKSLAKSAWDAAIAASKREDFVP